MGKDYKLVVGVNEDGEIVEARAKDWNFDFGRFIGGLTFYPYQISLGATLRYWPRIFTPSIRIHIGPFKVWCCWIPKLWIGVAGRNHEPKMEK